MKRRQYRNPPIEEAICELRFTPGPEAEFTAPARFYESIKSSYPGKPQYQQFVAAGIQVPAQPMTAQVALRQEGVKTLFPSQDGRRLVGLGMNLLSIHELKPYSGWEDFRSRIEQAIRAYQNAAAPIGVTRIAVRYINRVQVEAAGANVADYLIAAPRLPDELPADLRGFISRLESVYADQPTQLAITIAPVEPSSPAACAWLLDIDVSHEWASEPLPLPSVMVRLDDLKQRQREAFESLITDRSREVFDAR